VDPPLVGETQERAVSLTIAVLTYKRNDYLSTLLPVLVDHGADVLDLVPSVRVLVVDNDPAGGARETTQGIGQGAAVPVVYENEVVPGISAARNRALAVSGESDLLVFIDDDERPVEHWMRHLLDTYEAHGRPAAVLGPVRSEFEVEPDPWVASGDFFARRRLPTGTPVDVGATNNLLLDLRQTRRWGLEFDLAFGISGGSDNLFTKQIHAHGGRMVWSADAMVVDIVPAARVTRAWVLRRALRSGDSWSLTTLAVETGLLPRLRLRASLTGQGLVRVAGGGARFGLGTLTRSMRHQAKGARTFYRGVGMLMGALGLKYLEYKR
jgi:hypothetical protein